MISAWWLVATSFAWAVVIILHGRIAYKHGIWDGAFNHSLPAVQREIQRYDAHRGSFAIRARTLIRSKTND